MHNQSQNKILLLALGGMGVLIAYFLLRISVLEGTISLPQVSGSTNLWVIFVTGLTVGGLTCLAVQGGLLASIIASREEDDLEHESTRKHTGWPTAAFLAAKLASYTVLGFILGAFGGAVSISPNVQITMQFIAGLYMVLVALNLLNIHPIFRYVIIQPPRFLTKMVRNQSKSKDLFAPTFLGAMTVFIPCGTTLAMEALAISSANAILGAAIMAAFVLGTTPLFFGLGFLTTFLGDNFQTKFLKIAAIGVIYLGITSMNGALVASGSLFSLQSLAENSPIQIDLNAAGKRQAGYQDTTSGGTNLVKKENGVQVADITVTPNGYNPTYIQVKSGEPVKLNLLPTEGLGCTSVFRIPQLGIIKMLSKPEDRLVEFTPTTPGKLTYTCGMGMYRGEIEVI